VVRVLTSDSPLAALSTLAKSDVACELAYVVDMSAGDVDADHLMPLTALGTGFLSWGPPANKLGMDPEAFNFRPFPSIATSDREARSDGKREAGRSRDMSLRRESRGTPLLAYIVAMAGCLFEQLVTANRPVYDLEVFGQGSLKLKPSAQSRTGRLAPLFATCETRNPWAASQ
jgi:hypothetical protein